MGMFIQGRVAVTAAGEIDEGDIKPEMDVIFIRTKMDYGTRQQLMGRAAKISMPAASKGPRDRRKPAPKAAAPEMSFDVGAWRLATLQLNILDWRGPSFVGVPCTPSNVARLDPSEPLIAAVEAAIAARNPADEDETPDDADVTVAGDSDDEDIDPETAAMLRPNAPAAISA